MFCAMSLVFRDQTNLVLLFRYLQESSLFATCRKQGQIKPSGVPGRRWRRALMNVSQLESLVILCAYLGV